jgi:glycosyltransferase involved in cell wall biosynthesis
VLEESQAGSTSKTVIVVPCYNEAARWRESYWHEILEVTGAQFIFVNDGSSDATLECIERICDNQRVYLLNLPRNSGKAEAVRLGMLDAVSRSAQGAKIVGFLDADGAFGAEDIQRMISLSQVILADGYEALWSSRVALSGRQVSRSMSRHYIGRVIATYLSRSVPGLPYDSQSGFKLFKDSQTLRECIDSPFRTRWLFDVELLSRWRDNSGNSLILWEEPVMEWRDIPGSKIRGTELARIAREVLTVSRSSRSSSRRSSR